jgi:hypothetical protein
LVDKPGDTKHKKQQQEGGAGVIRKIIEIPTTINKLTKVKFQIKVLQVGESNMVTAA